MNKTEHWLANQEFRISPYNDLLIQSRDNTFGSIWIDYWYKNTAEQAKKELDRLQEEVEKLNKKLI